MARDQDEVVSKRFSRRKFTAAFSAAMASAACAGSETIASGNNSLRNEVKPDQYANGVKRAIGYLESPWQAQDGSFSAQASIGVTALVVTALLRHGRRSHEPLVARSLRYIEAQAQPDGGIYSPGSTLVNYETCLAIMCLAEADCPERYSSLLRKAEAFVRGHQWDESNEKTSADTSYGGAGYGKHNRPDLSNTAFLIDALKECGRDREDPAIQKALMFVSRCQNFESEYNTTSFAAKNPDGGFYYTCAAGGSSSAGITANGGLRSYGSMTYSGLKSMIYAGVGPDDPRVKAAIGWIRAHYDLATNPGLGDAGLYYYYQVFAKTMHVLGGWSFEDRVGVSHDWRSELAAVILRRQQTNGSWVNENNRWMEGNPNLVTAYALLALSYCRLRA